MNEGEPTEHRFRLLLLLMLGLVGLHLIVPDARAHALLGNALGAGFLIAALVALRPHGLLRTLGWALAVVPLAGLWSSGGLGGSVFHAPFFLFGTLLVSVQVLRSERVSEDTLIGSICGYLFLCLTFASLFTLVERVAPGSFSGMFEGQPRFSSLAYFSLVTLTTLGYGDITPATRFAESLVILESVCGLLYPTVVVARLVSLYMLGESPAAPRTERSAGALPVMVLAGLLVVTPLAVPWLEQNPGATALERIAIGALLLVCLRAIAVGRRVRFAAAACLALAVGASLWTDPGGRGVVVTLGIALQAGLLTWVIVLLTRWTFQQERVKDGVLIGSLCLLLLTGFDFALFFEVALRLSPGALVMEGEPSFARLSYFSFMTLTTTGFGDITPGIPAVRALAVIESTIGIFYPAIVLARLVSLYRSSE